MEFWVCQGEELKMQIGALAYVECSSKTQQVLKQVFQKLNFWLTMLHLSDWLRRVHRILGPTFGSFCLDVFKATSRKNTFLWQLEIKASSWCLWGKVTAKVTLLEALVSFFRELFTSRTILLVFLSPSCFLPRSKHMWKWKGLRRSCLFGSCSFLWSQIFTN